MFVKVCGITDPMAAETCVEVGADAVGFVFSESPRRISPEAATAIAEDLPPGITRVAVFRHPSRTDVEAVLEGFSPDVIQADHDSLHGIHGFGLLPVYRESRDVRPEHDRFLYEGAVSGVGMGVDLEQASGVARLGDMVLAGGLRPDNVGRAIEVVRPYGVDVSSGVEVEPGVKDPALIRSFVAAVRAAEERLVST